MYFRSPASCPSLRFWSSRVLFRWVITLEINKFFFSLGWLGARDIFLGAEGSGWSCSQTFSAFSVNLLSYRWCRSACCFTPSLPRLLHSFSLSVFAIQNDWCKLFSQNAAGGESVSLHKALSSFVCLLSITNIIKLQIDCCRFLVSTAELMFALHTVYCIISMQCGFSSQLWRPSAAVCSEEACSMIITHKEKLLSRSY